MNTTDQPTAEEFILARLMESDAPLTTAVLAEDAPVSYGRVRQVLSDLTKQGAIQRLSQGHYALHSKPTNPREAGASPVGANIDEAPPSAHSYHAAPMEMPRGEARAASFPEGGFDVRGRVSEPPVDHPHLSTIAMHPDYILVGEDNRVRFRVSLHVEAAPPVVRYAGPGKPPG